MSRSFLPKRPSRLFASLLSFFSINLIILSASIPAPAQGFGRLKMDIDLHSYTPPRILLEGTNILIQVTAQAGVSQHYLDQFKKGLEDLVPAADPRLRPVSHNPETIIYVEITALNSSSRQEIRTQSVYRKIGEHTEYDETTKMNRTVEHYGYLDETYNVTIVDGFLSALYECIDVNTGDLIDSDTITARFHQEYTFESPGPGEVEYCMMWNVISNIRDRFGADVGTHKLHLPKGKLKGTSEMLQKMMWNSALEKLSAMRPLKDPEDDAFRLYSIAIAYHGLSGSTRDLESNRYYMEKAVSYYREAVRKNPREGTFRQAQTLAEESLANYRRVETLLASYEAKRRQRGAAISGTQPSARPGPTDPAAITNDTVIAWVKAGLSEEEIRSRIKKARAKSFDLTWRDEAHLLASGVSPRTVDDMRNSVSGGQQRSSSRRGLILDYVITYLIWTAPILLK